mgnify:FL=1
MFPLIAISGALAVNDTKRGKILNDRLGDSIVFLMRGPFSTK